MAILRPKDVRKMKPDEIKKRLSELQLELSKERGNISIGATTTSPGHVKEIKKTIARLKTVEKENTSKGEVK